MWLFRETMHNSSISRPTDIRIVHVFLKQPHFFLQLVASSEGRSQPTEVAQCHTGFAGGCTRARCTLYLDCNRWTIYMVIGLLQELLQLLGVLLDVW